MELLLDLPPLHLSFQSDAIKTNIKAQNSEIRALAVPKLTDLVRNFKELEINLIDECITKYIFVKRYVISIPSRDEWFQIRIKFEERSDVWFTDGSGIDGHTGYGIFHWNNGENRSKGWINMTVFQAEETTINVCVEKLMKESARNRIIYISSDSSAALKAPDKAKITSKLVHETCVRLNQLGLDNIV